MIHYNLQLVHTDNTTRQSDSTIMMNPHDFIKQRWLIGIMYNAWKATPVGVNNQAVQSHLEVRTLVPDPNSFQELAPQGTWTDTTIIPQGQNFQFAPILIKTIRINAEWFDLNPVPITRIFHFNVTLFFDG